MRYIFNAENLLKNFIVPAVTVCRYMAEKLSLSIELPVYRIYSIKKFEIYLLLRLHYNFMSYKHLFLNQNLETIARINL